SEGADIAELVEIDLGKAQVLMRYPVPGAKFLNDLAAATDGRVYIADTMNNAIYLFEKGAVSEWRAGPRPDAPNGLVIDGSNLIVSSVGDITKGFDKIKPSNVKKVDLA